MEFVIANRDNADLMQNSEYRYLANVAERELTARSPCEECEGGTLFGDCSQCNGSGRKGGVRC